jgi:glutamyl-tRNA synthetase
MIDRVTIDSLFPVDLPEPDYWEAKYPARDIPEGAKVTRFAPSPTGSLHIGGVYTATIAKAVAQYSGGSYFVRIEDTDQSREVAGAAEQFPRALAYFRVESDETDGNSMWGPYRQSARAAIYLTYVRELLRRDRAYLCFCTKQELAVISDEQTAAKIPTGYYGEWARWRDAPAERVMAELSAGTPYVVRFRSPESTGRVRYHDGIRGWIEHDDNRNDAVILTAVLRAIDEDGWQLKAEAIETQGHRSVGRLLHRGGISSRRGPLLPARPRQRQAGRTAYRPSAR